MDRTPEAKVEPHDATNTQESPLRGGVINVIVGVPTDGDSNRAHKAHARLMESLSIRES